MNREREEALSDEAARHRRKAVKRNSEVVAQLTVAQSRSLARGLYPWPHMSLIATTLGKTSLPYDRPDPSIVEDPVYQKLNDLRIISRSGREFDSRVMHEREHLIAKLKDRTMTRQEYEFIENTPLGRLYHLLAKDQPYT